MKFTEAMLEEFSQPLSETEDNQCKHAIRMVRDALKELGFTDDGKEILPLYTDTYSYSLQMRSISGRKIKIFIQGSYANNTNVRNASDVDVAVVQEEVFTAEYRVGNPLQSGIDYGFVKAAPAVKTFKDEVQECLMAKFGKDVERKNKSIKVHGNTYRKDADTVPCMRYRDYRGDYRKDTENFIGGIVIFPDRGPKIINYPEQHIANGRKKNTNTNRHYKKYVRIIKKMRYLMEESSVIAYKNAAKNVNSFMLESLLWNIPDIWYLENCAKYNKLVAFKMIIIWIIANKEQVRNFREANGIKPLCPNEDTYNKLCTFIDKLFMFYQI